MSTGIQLSGVVVCQDNEPTIGAVVDALVPFCDEVVVVAMAAVVGVATSTWMICQNRFVSG